MEYPAKPLARSDAGILALLLGANLVLMVPDILLGALYPAMAAHYGLPLETVVLLTTPRALAHLGILLLGPLSDRFGRARLLVGGLALGAASAWGGALAPGLLAMAAVQVGMGLSLAIGNAAIPALVGDRYAYGVRGRALAIIRLAMPLTLIVAVPALVALSSRAGIRAPFVALGVATTAVAGFAAWQLPGAVGRAAGVASHWPLAARLPARVLALLALGLCLMMVPSSIFSFLAAWVGQTFGNPGVTVGVAVACDGVGALVGVTVSAALVDRLTKRRAAALGMVAAAAFATLLPAGRVFPLACLAIAGLSASLELTFVALMALLSEMVPQARGTVMALWAAALALGAALAPLGARAVWSAWGMAGLGRGSGALLATLAVALALIAAEPGHPPARG